MPDKKPKKLSKSEKKLKRLRTRQERAKNGLCVLEPRNLAPAHDDDETILVSFRNLVPDIRFGFNAPTMDDQARKDLLSQIHKITQVDWNELQRKNKHDGGPELLPKTAITVTLAPCITEDMANLTVFRFNSQGKRMVGYRQGRIFYVVWIESNHDLYNHGD